MPGTRTVPSVARWSDPESEESFRTIAAGLCELAGFGTTIVYVRRGEKLAIVAIAGADRMLDTDGTWWDVEDALGEDTTPEVVLGHLNVAEDWGLFKFIHHDYISRIPRADVAWVPDIEVSDAPNAWHPDDMLIAPIYDEQGVLRGALGTDAPISGLLPDASQRQLLESYARQARRAILTALAREDLSEKARLTDAARSVIRSAVGHDTISGVMDQVGAKVIDYFGLVGLRARVLLPDEKRTEYADAGRTPRRLSWVDSKAALASRILWERNLVGIIAVDEDGPGILGEDLSEVRDYLRDNEMGSVALIPIGIGRLCLGSLALFRGPDSPSWTALEINAALEMGRDLTVAMATQRALRREQETVRELQQLDEYKDQLIATVAHELKTPLTAILGQAELMRDEQLPEDLMHPVEVVERSAKRMVRVINDLLMLASDNHRGQGNDLVDLIQSVTDSTEMLDQMAHKKRIELRIVAPKHPVVVVMDRTELDRIVLNLGSNAIKYSPAGSVVTIAIERTHDHAFLTVSDQGIGIAEHDLNKLFSEFFRSKDPSVRAQPGTGLGLAISDRIVRRYGGRIEVSSELGVGSTFRVVLPTLAD